MNEKLDINVGSREKRAIILEFNIYIYTGCPRKSVGAEDCRFFCEV
jgi:hypothetical protein